jgi:hypothetical protein
LFFGVGDFGHHFPKHRQFLFVRSRVFRQLGLFVDFERQTRIDVGEGRGIQRAASA